MKGWLLDENLPSRLAFTPTLPVTPATAVAPNPTDSQLWAFARERELVIVTKDADFSDRIILEAPPPWVVHLRFRPRSAAEMAGTKFFRASRKRAFRLNERCSIPMPPGSVTAPGRNQTSAFAEPSARQAKNQAPRTKNEEPCPQSPSTIQPLNLPLRRRRFRGGGHSRLRQPQRLLQHIHAGR
jgi:predicted nuclease of predicted toxin-antitoxin system